MKILPVIPILLLSVLQGFSQPVNWKKLEQLDPAKILVDPAEPPTQALLLGAFHFGYPGLDAHKTDSLKMIDVLSPQRQKEIRQLNDVIVSFKPTRFYIEMKSQRYADSLYNAYLAGTYSLERDEIDQIAFRLAKELGHKKIYAVDAFGFAQENYKKYTFIDSIWYNKTRVDTVRDKKFDERYFKLYEAGDSMELTMTMLENFLAMADPRTLRYMHGHYLTAGFNTTDHKGADGQAIGWYDRNLRIFNKILQTRPASNDRIVVLFGAGHMPILKHCFVSSPEFNVVELKDLDLQMQKAGKIK
ncbi:DUF5694 domain-containing protein [Paraflavitalea pollutisoli]|uniref:DUF5694 domain-containing protein n=1 Tax=Paraflavitalea pollutisoli TaxID=3034143 RepID=UPI0023EB8E49|nr:DUF5694 domain-containing protein [Paraflavitalea sp. H1-2-19X]